FSMSDYEASYGAHRLVVPERFNFGRDVVDVFAEDPRRLALIWCNDRGEERRFSFAEIRARSNQVANWLAERGVAKGERVVVMLPRVPEWQIAMVACLKLGAVPIPCITMLTARDVGYRVAHSGAVAAITTSEETGKFGAPERFKARLAVGRPVAGWSAYAETAACATDYAACDLGAEEPAVMYYTSGSTGHPKGVCHAARALFAWRVSAQYWLSLDGEDLMWCTADTGWSKAGTSILFGPWSRGSAVLFYDGPFDAAKRLQIIERYKVSVFCAAATELRRLILEDARPYDLSSLRLTVSAGESVNPEVLEAWTSMTKVPLLDGYGQTETLMTVLNYPGMAVKPGSMGKALPGVATGVLTEAGVLAGPGSEGQLLIRLPNPQVMLGYWNDPQRTAESIITLEGVQWFKTGDNVRWDEDGYLFYLGRSDDIINSAGYRIGPQEVENALIEHAAVRESAVIGVPDPERGEIVKAFVILHDPASASDRLAEELQAHVKAMTAPYKYPRRIAFVDELPKTISGKIQRAVLRRNETGR
ncbi:MAG: AMP-binding protein, partial [Kiloniellales bacterium]